VFVLTKNRRLQYANPAWEKLTGTKLDDALGMVCSARRHSSALAAALAPTPEALAGRPDTARRPAPPNRTGPPWWDVSFAPLAGDGDLLGVVGFITVIGEPVPAAARKIPAAVMAIRDRHASTFTFDLLAGTSPTAERFVAQARLAAQTTAPVWVVGEPGSGKETTARVIHHAGAQRERMFVGVDCAGLQPYLIESLLAGHGGLAGSDRVGTVYLKDPAALPRDLQQHLAELFADAKPNAPRLVCGSAHTAAEDARDRGLIPDFHAGLSVLEIRVPPLRERADDIARTATRLLEKATAGIDPSVFEVASAYPWPGNLRELRDVLAGAVATAGTGRVTRDHLPWDLRVRAGLDGPPPASPPLKLDAILEAVEKRLLRLALRKAGGNATRAAELLGVWRARLLRRVQALGLGNAGDSTTPPPT
jgi:DNA-binding NtrC family response regulator